MSLRTFTKLLFQSGIQNPKFLRLFSTYENKIKSSYYYENGTFPYSKSTLGGLIDEAAGICGDDVLLSFPFQEIRKTFLQFKEETDQLACGLINLGLRMGDRIAVYGPNSYQWVLTQYAASKAGLITVTPNPVSTPQELAYALDKVGCRAIVAPEFFKTIEYYKVLCATIPELPNSQPGQINSQRLKHLKNVIIVSDKTFPGAYRFKDVMEASDSAAKQLLYDARKKIQFDSPAVILFTSGSTGFPKAAVLSHFQVVNQVNSYVRRAGLMNERPVICLQVPLFHVIGNVGGVPTALLCKGKCVFPSEYFDVKLSLKAIQEEKCTIVYGVPTMHNEIVRQIRSLKFDAPHWKKVIVGGAPVPMELLKALQELGLTVLGGYGATETTGAICMQSPSEFDKNVGSNGRPMEYAEVKIVDVNGDIVPVNTHGEVLIRSPFVYSGYWNQEKTVEALDSTRWYHSGDMGRMDENGNVYITGRKTDMIIRGGENIYPVEVEHLLMTHPAVEDVHVIGVPDKKMGEEICASIKLKAGCAATEEEIKEFCKDKISRFKVPRYILFSESFPKTGSGKILKTTLKEECIKRLKLQTTQGNN